MKDQTTFHTLWPAANGTRTTPSLSAMVARKKIKFFLFLASSGREELPPGAHPGRPE